MRNLCPKLSTILPVAFLAVVISVTAYAQNSTEPVLVPLIPTDDGSPIHGAFGSEWITEVVATNNGSLPLPLFGTNLKCPIIEGCEPVTLPTGATSFLRGTFSRCGSIAGVVLRVPNGRAKELSLNIRTQDISRQNQTWGTTTPAVTAPQLFDNPFSLSNIPTDSHFRATLRVYDVDSSSAPSVRVRMFAVDAQNVNGAPGGDELIADIPVIFAQPTVGPQEYCPAYAEVPLFTDVRPGAQAVRVEIDPLDGRREYWGFVSVVHDETQFVTNIVP